jgi:dephospho-CoA kinase
MILLGLTGSIGMGKTATAQMFRDLGVPVYDADQAVHDLYKKDGAGVVPIEAEFPGVTVEGAIDRDLLSKKVMNNEGAFRKLEQIIHPLVKIDQQKFMATVKSDGESLVVLDIPLLFEGGGNERCDVVVVVSAPAPVQRARVLERPGMTEDKLDAILSRQTPDAEKRSRADFIIETDKGLEDAAGQVAKIVDELLAK